MPKTLDNNTLKQEFEEAGYKLIAIKSAGINGRPLIFVCRYGKVHNILLNNWRRVKQCSCHSEMERRKRRYLLAKESLALEKYELRSNTYISCHKKMDIRCPQGHAFRVSWRFWKRGSRCPYCSRSLKLQINFIKKEFKNEGYKLLTQKYRNSKQKLKYRCPNNHLGSVSWANWNQKYRCRKCYAENIIGSNNPAWKGGISAEPYCFVWNDSEFRAYIKDRDKDKFCWNPLCKENGNHRQALHHIDYNKKNCDPLNIITICHSCNSKANFNREFWQDFYSRTMSQRFPLSKVVNL